MSKAEDRGKTYALHKASEKLHVNYGNAMLSVLQFDGYDMMSAYKEGYHQAERDLELTWEDIQNIRFIIAEMMKECFTENMSWNTHEEFSKEVLKRFKENRK